MKSILYILAIAAILAGAWFSYDSMNKYEALTKQRKEQQDTNEILKANVRAKKKEAKEMHVLKDKAIARHNEADSSKGLVESKLKSSKTIMATWKNKIASLDEDLDEVAKVKKEIKEAFKSLGPVNIREVSGLVKQLEEDLKEANKKLEELNALTEAASKRVATNNSKINELDTRIAKRAERIKGNSAQGRITAVNHDWGFVTIEIPRNMPVSAESKLIVKRGNSYVGDLAINAIEGSRIIADIKYKTMTPGMVVQPGDSVILAKPVTN